MLYTEQQTFLSTRKKMRIIVKRMNFGVAFRARIKKNPREWKLRKGGVELKLQITATTARADR